MHVGPTCSYFRCVLSSLFFFLNIPNVCSEIRGACVCEVNESEFHLLLVLDYQSERRL